MKRLAVGIEILRPVFLGILAGGLGTSLLLPEIAERREARQREAQQQEALKWAAYLHEAKQRKAREHDARQSAIAHQNWLADDLHDTPCSWCYMKVENHRWSATRISNLSQLEKLINTSDTELVFPVFPTVYMPNNEDELYYRTILESDIERGDKVLVIGTGSGSDAWIASLKSQNLVYIMDINPMAIANARTTARLGSFRVKAICGDIRDVQFPDDFSNFDYVLWNMPFLNEELDLREIHFHDGDDGSILKSFLASVRSLLKKDGQAIILNTPAAGAFIKSPDVTAKKDEQRADVMLYIIRNTK